jgi:hypothetical protein
LQIGRSIWTTKGVFFFGRFCRSLTNSFIYELVNLSKKLAAVFSSP